MFSRRSTILLSFVVLIIAQLPAAGSRERASDLPVVAVSILPQSYFVERISGGTVRPLVIVGAGQSPHSYEPTPRQLADLAGASAWFTVGVEFEHALEPKIAGLYPKLSIVDTTTEVRFRLMEAHSHDDDDHEDDHDDDHEAHEGRDPHIWLGRDSVKAQARAIRDALAGLYPSNAALYKRNYEAFAADIDRLFDGLARDLAPLRGKPVFVFHPAFGYFLDEFGIVQEAVETGGKEPTQKALAELIAKAKEEGAKVIFVQAQFPANAARSVAQAIGGEVVQIDPLAADWSDNLRRIAEALRKAAR
jgi:zinc transport system substrate-binding protein